VNEDDDYAEFLADYIISYLAQQHGSGREFVYESEIWKLLGQELPEGRPDQKFRLKDYTQVKANDNVVSINDYKKKLH